MNGLSPRLAAVLLLRGEPSRSQRGKRTMHDEQNTMEPAAAATRAARPAPRRRLLLLAALALLVPAAIVGVYFLIYGLPDECKGQVQGEVDLPARPLPMFYQWGQPDLVLIVSGQMHGFMLPCGCSEPQYGGLVRRGVFIDRLKAKGWPVVGIDLGELGPTTGIKEQRDLKFQFSMKALDVMGYRAFGIGKSEMLMPLIDALALYSAQQKVARPRPLASSLKLDKNNRILEKLGARPYEVFGGGAAGTPRVGVLSLTGPDLADTFRGDKVMQFLNNSQIVVPGVQKAFAKEQVEMAILMHHDYPNDPVLGGPAATLKMEKLRHDMAEKCAVGWEAARKKDPAIPPLQLLMVLTEHDEPPSMLRRVPTTPTYILEIGHKGKYVGVVGVFRKNGGLELKYELVLMEPKLQPKVGERTTVLDVLEEYTKQVKAENLLDKYIRAPHPIQIDPWVKQKYGGSRFIGSDRCEECHAREYAIWYKTKHKVAFKTLTQAVQPSLRQYDPECVVCHTVGFKHPEGYNDLPHAIRDALAKNPAAIPARLAKHNKALAHVGCESCHGPGSAHANNPNDARVRELMNPYRPSDKEKKLVDQMNKAPNPAVRQQAAAAAQNLFNRRMQRLEDFCTKCHDEQNDVNWAKVPFLEKWAGGERPPVHNGPNNVGNIWLPPLHPGVPANFHK
jgi:hypothetical protein